MIRTAAHRSTTNLRSELLVLVSKEVVVRALLEISCCKKTFRTTKIIFKEFLSEITLLIMAHNVTVTEGQNYE